MPYAGPKKLRTDIDVALTYLAGVLSVSYQANRTHSVMEIGGPWDEEDTIEAVAVYLVGAIAACIDFNMKLQVALFNRGTIKQKLPRNVADVIGANNLIDNRTKTYVRDPWIWEGISHMLMHLSLVDQHFHPPGALFAKSSIHLSVKEQGLDIIALFDANDPGLTVAECKAYLKRAESAVTDAAKRLAEVDTDKRDAEIRHAIGQMRGGLARPIAAKITEAFWKEKRAYFPMVLCDAAHAVDWKQDRQVLGDLAPPVARKVLVPLSIDEARKFCDRLADAMRLYSRS